MVVEVGLPDSANKNVKCPIKSEFQINNKFAVYIYTKYHVFYPKEKIQNSTKQYHTTKIILKLLNFMQSSRIYIYIYPSKHLLNSVSGVVLGGKDIKSNQLGLQVNDFVSLKEGKEIDNITNIKSFELTCTDIISVWSRS